MNDAMWIDCKRKRGILMFDLFKIFFFSVKDTCRYIINKNRATLRLQKVIYSNAKQKLRFSFVKCAKFLPGNAKQKYQLH